MYKYEISGSLLRSKKWTQKVTPYFDYVVNYTRATNRGQKWVPKTDPKSDPNFHQILQLVAGNVVQKKHINEKCA
jgi:hypothetical protein